MSVLIITHYADFHAEVVAWGLRKAGVPVHVWIISDLPSDQAASFNISDDYPFEVSIRDTSTEQRTQPPSPDELASVKVVWNRRIGKSSIESTANEADKEFLQYETRSFVLGLLNTIAPEAIWINPQSASVLYELKLAQLVLAREVGLSVPRTLISNDPLHIQSFVRGVQSAVFKPFRFPLWYGRSDGKSIFTYTTEINAADVLDNAASLQLCPGIFQEKIEKSYELRVVYIGGEAIAVRLDSQQHEHTKIDWRSGQGLMDLREQALPIDVLNKIESFMSRAGLRFGCFDMIVTPAGHFVFLEINIMGQFLWLEDNNPSINVLARFLHFLAQSCGVSRPVETFVSLAEFKGTDAYQAFSTVDPEKVSRQLAIGWAEDR